MDTAAWNNTGSYHPPGAPSPPSSSHIGPILTFALCLLLLVFRPTTSNSYSKSRRRPPPYPKGNHLFPAPIVGTRIPVLSRWHFFFRGPSLIREGYAKYKDVPFKLSGHDYLILPAKYLAELSRMPPEKLSLNLAIAEVFQRHPGFTGVMTDHSVQKKAVATRLTAGLPGYIPRMQLRVGRVLEEAVGSLPDSVKKRGGDVAGGEWKTARIHDLAKRMTLLTVGPGFVVELAEDENYMSATEQFVQSSFMHLLFLQFFPEWAKPFAAMVFPPSWRVESALESARGLLVPIIEERRRRLRLEREGEQQYTKPDDLLQHLMDVADGAGGEDAEATMQRLMAMNFGACGAVVDATAKVLLDLCEHPECVEPIRQEIADVLARDGGVSFSKRGLAEMKRLDSFMRESHRLAPTTHRNLALVDLDVRRAED
jgi:ent-kaurene oxidase